MLNIRFIFKGIRSLPWNSVPGSAESCFCGISELIPRWRTPRLFISITFTRTYWTARQGLEGNRFDESVLSQEGQPVRPGNFKFICDMYTYLDQRWRWRQCYRIHTFMFQPDWSLRIGKQSYGIDDIYVDIINNANEPSWTWRSLETIRKI